MVDPGYLTDKLDIKRIEKSWEVLESLCHSHNRNNEWFSGCLELLPGPFYKLLRYNKNKSSSYLKAYASDFGLPYFHWSGTLAMKSSYQCQSEERDNNDSAFVVDEQLKVYQFENLYVCDASIFPGNISCPLALTCAGLGFFAASLIEKDLIHHKSE